MLLYLESGKIKVLKESQGIEIITQTEEGKLGGKDGCKGRLEAATVCQIIFVLIGQGNVIFLREKAGKSQGKVREF